MTLSTMVVVVSLLDTRHYRYAPETTFNLGADYSIPVGSGDLTFTANYKFTDEFWVTPGFDLTGNNRDLIESHGTFDLSAVWSNGDFSLSVYGLDVTHSGGRELRKFDAGAFWFSDVEPHRTYGAQVQYNF